MSWDLWLVPREAGEEPGDWIEMRVDEALDREAARPIAEAAAAAYPGLAIDESDDIFDVSGSDALPISVLVDAHHAEIAVPYWDISTEVADALDRIVAAITTQTGWAIYDPQEDAYLQLAELRGAFERGHGQGREAAVRIEREQGLHFGPPSSQPKRKKRFGLF